jgi:hypothetical protein
VCAVVRCVLTACDIAVRAQREGVSTQQGVEGQAEGAVKSRAIVVWHGTNRYHPEAVEVDGGQSFPPEAGLLGRGMPKGPAAYRHHSQNMNLAAVGNAEHVLYQTKLSCPLFLVAVVVSFEHWFGGRGRNQHCAPVWKRHPIVAQLL